MKKATARTPAKKARASKAAKKSPTPRTAAKKSAALIAGIPITRAELEPLLGRDTPQLAYIYSSTFTTKLDPEAMRAAIAAHASELRAVKAVAVHDYPPPDGTQVVVTFDRKMVAVTIKRSAGRCVLTAHYRAAGESWGSNHALFIWLETTILPWLGATKIQRGPWPHARPAR